MIRSYNVYLTQIIRPDDYAPFEIDITERVLENGVSKILQQVDAGDYDRGIFTYGEVSLTVNNKDGYFSDERDPRSIFVHSRDLCKIRVEYVDSDGNPYNFFQGLIAEEGTRDDDKRMQVRFRVLARDSVFNKVKTRTGIVANGVSAFENFRRLLTGDPKVESIINFNPAKINPLVNTLVDDASFFDERPLRESIDALLVGCNSVLQIDSVGDIVIRSRRANTNTPFEFFNYGDQLGRENIIELSEVNNGLQRVFNSVIVRGEARDNNGNFTDPRYVKYYNLRSKEISLEYLTDEFKMRDIARSIAEESSMPRLEVQMTVATEDAKDIQMLDLVRVRASPRHIAQPDSTPLPLWGSFVWGQSTWPITEGNSLLDPNVMWKVIAIEHTPRDLTTTIKLRQRGTVNFEGWE